MTNTPIPPTEAFHLGASHPDLKPGQQRQRHLADDGKPITRCAACRIGTLCVVTSSRMDAAGNVDLCAHAICATCHRKWPGCPHTWDDATQALLALAIQEDL